MTSPVIKIRRSAVQNNAPTAAQLELGELALNTYDGKLFTEINDGTVSIVEIGGHLQHLAVSGISTFAGNIDANGALDVAGNITLGGTVDGRNVASDGTKLDGIESSATADQTASEIRALVESASDSNVFTDADHSKLNNIEASATADQTASEILTLIKTVDGAGSGLDADTLDGISSASFVRSDAADTVAGALTFSSDATFNADIEMVNTGTDSSAGPILDLYRNSSSPADADYLGQIKFQGKNDAGQKIVYSKITGKILDASDGTEDGIIEFAFKKAGSNNISGRFRSDSLQLLNGTNLSVAGDSTLTGGLDVDGHTEIDNLKSVGIATFSNNAIHANVYSTGISTISGFRFPSSDGSEDQALVTDGSGNLSFKTLSGGSATGTATTISTGISTATAGQTVFTTTHPHNDGTSTYSHQVFVNGLKMRPSGAGASTRDFASSSNSTITFYDGLTLNDEVRTVVYFGHTLEEEYFTATAGQTVFALSGNLTAQKNFKVYINGVKLRNGTDYGVAAPVTLTTPATVGDHIEITCDNAEDAFTATAGQASFTPTSTDISSDNMQVYINGIVQNETDDYTIGNPSVTITDGAGLTAGDQVDVVIRRS